MNRIHTAITLTLVTALIFSWAIWWKTERELREVINANSIIRSTLGELTNAIAQKDQEIDRLNNSPCPSQGQVPPDSRSTPPLPKAKPAKPSKTVQIGAK